MNSLSLKPGFNPDAGFALAGMAGRAGPTGARSASAGAAEGAGAGAFSTGLVAGATGAAGLDCSTGLVAGATGAAAFTGLAAGVLPAAAGLIVLTSGVFALALTFSDAVLAALAAAARLVVLLVADLAADLAATALLARDFAAAFGAVARVTARPVVGERRVAAARAAALAFLSWAFDLAFVVTFEVNFFVFLAEVFVLFFPLEAAAPRADLTAEADFVAEAERLDDFFAVALLDAAVFVTPLLAARLACVLERAAEPLARAAAVEAVADDFLSAFLLEGIRGLLLCCPAVETGRSPPLTNRGCRRQQSRDTAKGGMWKPC